MILLELAGDPYPLEQHRWANHLAAVVGVGAQSYLSYETQRSYSEQPDIKIKARKLQDTHLSVMNSVQDHIIYKTLGGAWLDTLGVKV